MTERVPNAAQPMEAHEVSIEEADAEDEQAKEFVLAYEGDFEFLLDIKSRFKLDPWYELTPNQTAAILRCKAREEARSSRPPESRSDGLDLSPLPDGTRFYAVENSEGKLTFLRIDHVREDDNPWDGWLFVKHIVGGTDVLNGMRIGMQKPNETYRGQWETLLRKVLDDPVKAGETFGKTIGRCYVCGKVLTDELSRQLGIGPICRG